LLGLLVFIHELGHFLVARMCGVRVEVFSLGFGKKILSWKKGDTTYCVSLIPLGGFVKMFGEQGSENIITDADRQVAFSHKSPWQRIAIVLAGPLMNFFFAVAIFATIAQVGEQTRAAVVAGVVADSPALKFGFKAGDKILKVENEPIQSYEDFQKQLTKNKNRTISIDVQDNVGEVRKISASVGAIDNPNIFSLEKQIGQIEGLESLAVNSTVAVLIDSSAYKAGLRTGDEVTSFNGKKITSLIELESTLQKAMTDSAAAVTEYPISVLRPFQDIDGKTDRTAEETVAGGTKLDLKISKNDLLKSQNLKNFGLDKTELYLGQVVKGSPADMAELQAYDRIVSINAKPILKWEDIATTVKAYDGREALTFVISRDGTELIKKITPKVTELTTAFGAIDKRYTVGVSPLIVLAEPEIVVVKADNPIQALIKGTDRTVDVSVMTVMSFVKLFQGEVSPKNLGGMVSIGKAAKDSFEMGAQAFFMTMGILSVSLFILNLMPIPVLDGGHLVFYTIELIKGSPLSLRKMEIAQQVGLVLLLALMVLAQYNDIVKFLFKS
ncbi:MAG: RIP metalloprotease RseP, partial [Bdellovibrionaceae bacterium]|nr:RIP metalloprotease RseP [Pseudobdellovibrionaceae bacterium]